MLKIPRFSLVEVEVMYDPVTLARFQRCRLGPRQIVAQRQKTTQHEGRCRPSRSAPDQVLPDHWLTGTVTTHSPVIGVGLTVS